VIAACVVGAIANFSLLFATAPAYTDPINPVFSMLSLGAFVGFGLLQTWTVLARPTT
jgi:hypothetical protein